MKQKLSLSSQHCCSFKSKALFGAAILSIILVSYVLSSFVPYKPVILSNVTYQSIRIYDRNQILLREILSDENNTSRWISVDELDRSIINAFLSAEDKRFFKHHGIDIWAISRSIVDAIRHRKISSGASTITQQLIRMTHHYPRSFISKLYEMWLALRLEHALSKSQILENYINRAPMGNLCYGIGAASYTYFKKSPTELTTAEAAFLAAILKSPTLYNPYRHKEKTLSRQKYILDLMIKNSYLDEKQHARFLNQTITIEERDVVFKAPHFCDRIVSKFVTKSEPISEIVTTLDWNLQRNLEYFVRGRIDQLRSSNGRQASVLVLDNATDEILVWIGSVDYFDEKESGQVDGIISRRQPGSVLKPFTYGLALQTGMTPATIIPDIETYSSEISGYFTPDNYDNRFHGPVTIRRALACSYNIPPVRILESIGEANLLELLHQAGFVSLDKSPQFYGKGITLGNGEVTLLELVRGYAAFTRGGTVQRENYIRSKRYANGHIVPEDVTPDTIGLIFNESICALLLDILSDNTARIPAFGRYNPLDFPFECAAKTGTSKDYRDNWVIGCTAEVTAGVWVGNFNGEPMRQVSGIAGAGPIFNDVIHYLDKYYNFSSFHHHVNFDSVTICPLSGKLPSRDCPVSMNELFIPGSAPGDTCTWHKVIPIDDETDKSHPATGRSGDTGHTSKTTKLFIDLPPLYYPWMIENNIPFPPRAHEIDHRSASTPDPVLRITAPLTGEIYVIDSVLRRKFQQISLQAEVPPHIPEVEWFVDDELIAVAKHPYMIHWPLTEGVHKFQIRAGDLRSDQVEITVLPPQ